MTPPVVRWRAVNRSGVAHAFASPKAAALCGIANQDVRYDWPKRGRCDLCSELAATTDTAGAL